MTTLITAASAPALLMRPLKKKLVPMLISSPGVGKSDIINAIAREYRLLVIDLRLSQSDPTDMNGFPTMNEDRTRSHYAAPEDFPLEGDPIPIHPDGRPYNGWMLFLDEFNSAPPSVQAAAYKIVLDRKVGQKNLHDKVAIVAAGNLSTDRAIVNKLSTAMQSRMVHFQLGVDNEAWEDWAVKNNVDHRVIAFIKFKPDMIHNFKPDHSDHTFSCPRTWEFLSKMIVDYPEIPAEDIPLLTGTVGEAAGREFFAFSQVYQNLPTLRTIMADPTHIAIPVETSIQYAVSTMLGHNLHEQNIDRLMPYIDRLPVEFNIMCLQYAIKKNKKLMQVPVIKTWIGQNSKELF